MANTTDFDPSVTINLGSAGAVAGTTNTYTTTATTQCVINGKYATGLVAQTNVALPTTDATTGVAFIALAPNQCCALVLGQNAAGSIRLAQGPIIAVLAGSTTTLSSLINSPQFPALPNDFCPLAYTIVRTATAAPAWTPGTSSWAVSGVSASTFQNVAQLPNRPQAS